MGHIGDNMPKETFLNLSDDKRRHIENVAIKEFASQGFDKASINVIVKNSGIAKGSFYQYFDDKKDLFFHLLISVVMEKKLKYMAPLFKDNENYDFFTLIKEMFIAGLNFARENPDLDKIALWLNKNTNHSVYKELIKKTGNVSSNIYEKLLKKGQLSGDIKSNIDISYYGYILQALITSTMDYCLENSRKANIDGISDLSFDMTEKVDLMIEFLKEGIGNNNK